METVSARTRLGIAFALLAIAVAAALAVRSSAASPSAQQQAIVVQEAHTDALLARGGIVGTGVGQTATGGPEIVVFATRPVAVAGSFDGFPVDVEVTGPIGAANVAAPRKKPGGGGGGTTETGPTGFFARPVPIGVSTGNAEECSAGTIGARVRAGSNVYALSNNHVYALEGNAGESSEILQPGLYDTGCAYKAANHLGTLADYAPIEFTTKASNVIDAAIALTNEASLNTKTPANGYGEPDSQAQAATVGLAVQKYGRTSSLTTGKVIAVNAEVNVAYSKGTAHFVDQVVVEGKKPFLKSGDSGSLLVTQTAANPVGLLFASDASGKFAFANPIEDVLAEFGVTIDGK
jgi:hypothetical protein